MLHAAFRIPNFLKNIFGRSAAASFIPSTQNFWHMTMKKKQLPSPMRLDFRLAVSLIVYRRMTTPYLISAIAPDSMASRANSPFAWYEFSFPEPVCYAFSLVSRSPKQPPRFLFPTQRRSPEPRYDRVTRFLAGGGSVSTGGYVAWVRSSVARSSLACSGDGDETHPTKRPYSIRKCAVRTVIRNFFQFHESGCSANSAFVDAVLAAFASGFGGCTYLRTKLYTLPVSLFACRSRRRTAGDVPRIGSTRSCRCPARRLDEGLRRIAFFIVHRRWRSGTR